LDDPLSALDVRVARHVKEKCIDGLLRDKCVILVTHQTHFLRDGVTEVISIEAGKILRRGSYADVLGKGETVADPEELTALAIDDIELDSEPASSSEMVDSSINIPVVQANVAIDLKPKAEEELRRHGSVGWNLFFTYFKSGNSTVWLVLVLLITISTQVLFNGSDIWLKTW